MLCGLRLLVHLIAPDLRGRESRHDTPLVSSLYLYAKLADRLRTLDAKLAEDFGSQGQG